MTNHHCPISPKFLSLQSSYLAKVPILPKFLCLPPSTQPQRQIYEYGMTDSRSVHIPIVTIRGQFIVSGLPFSMGNSKSHGCPFAWAIQNNTVDRIFAVIQSVFVCTIQSNFACMDNSEQHDCPFAWGIQSNTIALLRGEFRAA
jgi:hypothetical protein